MRKIRLFLAGALIAGSMTVAAAAPEAHASTCCIPGTADVNLIAPSANTRIVISGLNVLSDQRLTVTAGGLLAASCSGPSATPYGWLWHCTRVTDWWVYLGHATNFVDADQSGDAYLHVYGDLGQDTVHTKNGHGGDLIDCGANDRTKDWIYKNTADTVAHCSSGNDRVGT